MSKETMPSENQTWRVRFIEEFGQFWIPENFPDPMRVMNWIESELTRAKEEAEEVTKAMDSLWHLAITHLPTEYRESVLATKEEIRKQFEDITS